MKRTRRRSAPRLRARRTPSAGNYFPLAFNFPAIPSRWPVREAPYDLIRLYFTNNDYCVIDAVMGWFGPLNGLPRFCQLID
jgi:hypothetical protein